MNRSLARALPTIATLCTVLACGEDPLPPPPPPSTTPLTILLESGAPQEGAGIIAIDATVVDSVVPLDDSLVFNSLAGDRLNVVVIRLAPGPILFKAWVSDATVDLNPTVVQVADPANQLRTDLRGYRVRVTQ